MRTDQGGREAHHRSDGGTTRGGTGTGKQSENCRTGHVPHDTELPGKRNGEGVHGEKHPTSKCALRGGQGDETGKRKPHADTQPEQRELRTGQQGATGEWRRQYWRWRSGRPDGVNY